MKQLVINKFDKVAVTIGTNCVHNVYNSLTEAIEAVSSSYYNTVWSEVNEDVRFYGWVTESNGYQHTAGNPIYTCKESSFWGGKMPLHFINIRTGGNRNSAFNYGKERLSDGYGQSD